jgi:hypothetical protein
MPARGVGRRGCARRDSNARHARSGPDLAPNPHQALSIKRANGAAQETQVRGRLALAETLLESERVELPQMLGKPVHPGMKEMKELRLSCRSSSVVDRNWGPSALAPDVHGFVSRCLEDPRGVDSSGWARPPER